MLNYMVLPLTQEEYDEGNAKHKDGVLIQHAFPTLNADQREFLMTGATPGEWDSVFPK